MRVTVPQVIPVSILITFFTPWTIDGFRPEVPLVLASRHASVSVPNGNLTLIPIQNVSGFAPTTSLVPIGVRKDFLSPVAHLDVRPTRLFPRVRADFYRKTPTHNRVPDPGTSAVWCGFVLYVLATRVA